MAGGYSREIWYKRLTNMKILLDTHVLVWALSSPEKIKPKVQDLLAEKLYLVNNGVLVKVDHSLDKEAFNTELQKAYDDIL